MPTAVIVDAVRTPGGKRNGKLKNWHPVDLAAEALKAIVSRNSLDPALVDDVIMGCVSQVGEQAFNVGRSAVLAAGWPESVPATTIDRQCGSSQQALHFAAQGVISGAYDIVIAAGVEAMSRVAMGSSIGKDAGWPFGPSVTARYEPVGGLKNQGIGAEMIADQWDVSREDLDTFSAESHRRAAAAWAEGRFEDELVKVTIPQRKGDPVVFGSDEGVRADATAASLGALRPIMKDGVVTAGNASQQNDAAAACLVVAEDKLEELGLKPMAFMVGWAAAGCEPGMMGIGPVPAVKRLFARTGLSWNDIDLVELNEAFACQVLAVLKGWGWDERERLNVNGGAIAVGHPFGMTGARITTTLLNSLQFHNATLGLETMCVGGGQGMAMIFERLS